MRDLLPELKNWIAAEQPFALATVVSTWGSAPRRAGSYMAVRKDGAILGSVSGGCVEGAVIEEAQGVITAEEAKLLHFGVADETAWDVGLACGGEIDVFVQPGQRKTLGPLIEGLEESRNMAHVFTLDEGKEVVIQDGRIEYAEAGLQLTNWVLELSRDAQTLEVGGQRAFYNPLPPAPELVIVGGVQIAQALVEMAQQVHFRPVLIDPRRAFLNADRFPNVPQEQLIQSWPDKAYEQAPLHASSAVASLTHDPKIDDPALLGALKSEAFYVGALGSRKTHKKRLKRLAEAGASEEQLARIRSPIGVDIAAANPEEIALAIMAQVVGAYRG